MTEPPTDSLVHARGLTKRFGDFTAVDGIDVEVRRGEAFGFLGPNGAGKSSTMRMIGCVSPVSGGELRILGLDPATDGPAIRARLGVVPQEDTLDIELTVRENLLDLRPLLRAAASRRSAQRADELLEFVQLTEKARRPRSTTLSGGMKRRLDDRPLADQRARPAAARRADHRPRPAGPARAVGPAVPAQAAGRHAGAHHPLHGRGRAALRPAGGDGQRPASSPRARRAELIARLLHAARWSSCASRSDEHERDGRGKLADLADRVEVLPDRLLLYTDDGEPRWPRCTSAGCARSRVLVRRSTLEDVFLRLTGRTLVD